MNKYEFMNMITESFEGLKSEKEIDTMANEMIKMIEQYKILAKGYLKMGGAYNEKSNN